MSIAQDLEKNASLIRRVNTAQAWQAFFNFLLAVSDDHEETTIGESEDGFIKAHYYYFADSSMLYVRGEPAYPNYFELRVYARIGKNS